jgi:hypothetical protein
MGLRRHPDRDIDATIDEHAVTVRGRSKAIVIRLEKAWDG